MGITVRLRPWQARDEHAVVRWSRDEAFCLANEWELGLEADYIVEFWRKRAAASTYLRMIEAKGEAVGYAEWQGCQDDEAELGIAIGDSRYWGRGIGTQAGRLMLDWGFAELGLRRVWAEVHEPNTRSVALMTRIGLRELSRTTSAEYHGQPVMMVKFEMTRADWKKLG